MFAIGHSHLWVFGRPLRPHDSGQLLGGETDAGGQKVWWNEQQSHTEIGILDYFGDLHLPILGWLCWGFHACTLNWSFWHESCLDTFEAPFIGGSEKASDPRVVVGGPIRTPEDHGHHFQQVNHGVNHLLMGDSPLPCLREGTNRLNRYIHRPCAGLGMVVAAVFWDIWDAFLNFFVQCGPLVVADGAKVTIIGSFPWAVWNLEWETRCHVISLVD